MKSKAALAREPVCQFYFQPAWSDNQGIKFSHRIKPLWGNIVRNRRHVGCREDQGLLFVERASIRCPRSAAEDSGTPQAGAVGALLDGNAEKPTISFAVRNRFPSCAGARRALRLGVRLGKY